MATTAPPLADGLDFHDKAVEVWGGNARGRLEVLTASATRIKVNDDDAIRKIIRRRYDSWQEDAWLFYDEIGEVKYALNFLANAMSKLRLFVGTRPDPDGPVVPVDPEDRTEIPPTTPENPNASALPTGISPELARSAVAELARLKSPQGGQPETMRVSALNMLVAGEFYLLGQGRVPGANPFDTDEEWTIRSIDELVPSGTSFRLKTTPNDQGTELDRNDYVARVHRRHGRWSEMADSNMRGVLASCEIVLMLDRMIRAIAKSRTHGGIFAVPDEVSFGSSDATTDEAGDGESAEDAFVEEFVEWLTGAASDEGSPASVAPGLLKVKGELIQYLKHFPLDRKLDDKIVELRTNELIRIAQGLDIQPEQMSGMGATNHWSAWLIDDVTWRSNLEPLAVDLVNAWTTAFLLPGLIEQGFSAEEVAPLMVWYDPTPLLSRPNTSADAKDAFNSEAISGDAYRAVIGFDQSDAPDENELLLRMLMKPRGYSPELIDAIARKVFPDLEIIAPPAPGSGPVRPPAGERPSEASPVGAPPQDEGPGKPSTPPETPLSVLRTQAFARRGVDVGPRLAAVDARLWSRLEAALNVAMRQALQKAGARLRAKAGTLRASVKGIPNELVAAHLGRDAVRAAGFSEDELLRESFDSLQTDFDSWTKATQQKALQIAANEGDLDESEIEALTQRQEDDRNAAWEWLVSALVALAAARLYSPSPAAPPQGEHSDELAVPPGLIREAMARAGGADNLEPTPRGGILADGGTRPAGGIGTGDLIRGVLLDAGFQEQGWIWQWSGALRPFEPHQDLDDYEFDSLDDEQLIPPAGYDWLGVDFMVPGDHDGCGCQLIPRLVAQVPVGVGSEGAE